MLCAPAFGQTPDRGAKKEVGQCYSSCMERAFETGKAAQDVFVGISDAMASADIRSLPEEKFEEWFSVATDNYCRHLQAHLVAIDACKAGCEDLEFGYRRTIASKAKRHFRQLYDRHTGIVRSEGLWNQDYSDFPEGEERTAACNALFGIGVGRSEAASALPRLDLP